MEMGEGLIHQKNYYCLSYDQTNYVYLPRTTTLAY